MDLKKCPTCGHMVENGADSCIYCHTVFAKEEKDLFGDFDEPIVLNEAKVLYNEDVKEKSDKENGSYIEASNHIKEKGSFNYKIIIAAVVLVIAAGIIFQKTAWPVILCNSATKAMEEGDYDKAITKLQVVAGHSAKADKLLSTANQESDIIDAVTSTSFNQYIFEGGEGTSSNPFKVEEVSLYRMPDAKEDSLAYKKPIILLKLDMSEYTESDTYKYFICEYIEDYKTYQCVGVYDANMSQDNDNLFTYSSYSISFIKDNYDEVETDVDIERINNKVSKTKVM